MHDSPSVRRLLEAIETKSPRTASCSANLFELTIHEARDGKKYLFVINPNVERSKGTVGSVSLAGEYRSGVDLDVPGGFPVAFKTERGRTTFSLWLDPGDFTLIELRK
jgi:hypothetical protein